MKFVFNPTHIAALLLLIIASSWTTVAAADSLCVKYTKLVFGTDTGANEFALLEAVVNLALLGDGDTVPGILAPDAGLVKFFDGSYRTTNVDGKHVKVNFLDDAAGIPNNLDPTSNTGMLLNHLYQFFGALLGCTASGFPAYQGDPDIHSVHQYMKLDQAQIDYFIQQVGLSATALGVSADDAAAIESLLESIFNKRCTPPLTAEDGVPAFLIGTNPSICTRLTCPVADRSACPRLGG